MLLLKLISFGFWLRFLPFLASTFFFVSIFLLSFVFSFFFFGNYSAELYALLLSAYVLKASNEKLCPRVARPFLERKTIATLDLMHVSYYLVIT